MIYQALGGRKVTLAVIGIVAATVLGALGQLTAAEYMEAMKWLVGIGAGSVAIEEGLAKFNGSKTEK